MRNAPELIEVESEELEEVLRRVEQSLDEKDSTLIRRVFESYAYVSDLIDDKNTSIRHLRQLFFGKRTEKTAAVVGEKTEVSGAPLECAAAAGTGSDAGVENTDEPSESDEAASSKGHGRNGADAYRGATRIEVRHPTLTAGDACPSCGQGTVYEKVPGVLVRIIGQPPLGATIYELQKLRCHLCDEVFTAPAPVEAGENKYDATAGSMIGLLKYGSGLPFNRLDGLQGNLEVPLPASTQWDIVRVVGANVAPAFEELVRQAAQGDVLHNDDTTIKILELMGPDGRQDALRSAAEDASVADERSGLYTSGVVALRDGHRVALFFSGRRHAGENLGPSSREHARRDRCRRPSRCAMPSSRNLPRELQTVIVAVLPGPCPRHGSLIDIYDRFPEAVSPPLLETLAVVYRNDAIRVRTPALARGIVCWISSRSRAGRRWQELELAG